MTSLKKKQTSDTATVVALIGDVDPPQLSLTQLIPLPTGGERRFSRRVPVRDPELWQQLLDQVQPGQQIDFTIETDWPAPGSPTTLLAFTPAATAHPDIDITTGIAEVTDLKGNVDPPIVALHEVITLPTGGQKGIPQWVQVRDPDVWERLVAQIRLGQYISYTIETDWDDADFAQGLTAFELAAPPIASKGRPRRKRAKARK